MIKRYSGLTNQAIGEIIGGVHYSAVSQAAARFANELEKDADLKMKISEIMSNIKA